jgi:hypothetical protein
MTVYLTSAELFPDLTVWDGPITLASECVVEEEVIHAYRVARAEYLRLSDELLAHCVRDLGVVSNGPRPARLA